MLATPGGYERSLGEQNYNVKPVVIKRDGCQVPFDEARIAQAIERAALAVGVVDADYCATVARVVAQRMEQQPRVDIHGSSRRWKTS